MDTRTKAREDTGLQGVWEAAEHGLGEEELGAGKRAETGPVGAHGFMKTLLGSQDLPGSEMNN